MIDNYNDYYSELRR